MSDYSLFSCGLTANRNSDWFKKQAKGTPKTRADTLAKKLKQVLEFQEAILLEQKTKIDAAKALKPSTLPQERLFEPEPSPAASNSNQSTYDPNRLFREDPDSLPF